MEPSSAISGKTPQAQNWGVYNHKWKSKKETRRRRFNMKLIASKKEEDGILNVITEQDGSCVDITINGDIIGFFGPNKKELVIYEKNINKFGLKLRIIK